MSKKEKVLFIISTIAGLAVALLSAFQVECLRAVDAISIMAGAFGAGAAFVGGLIKWKASSAKNMPHDT